ncbi:hypothetical protein ES703_40397 [subsurface metagenome]
MENFFNLFGTGRHLNTSPAIDYGYFLSSKTQCRSCRIHSGITTADNSDPVTYFHLITQIYLSQEIYPTYNPGTVFSFNTYLHGLLRPNAQENGIITLLQEARRRVHPGISLYFNTDIRYLLNLCP